MHAEMRPAIWIRRVGGFVSAQSAAPISIQPHRKPRLGRLVIQNNRVAKGIGKRTLAAAVGHASEGHASVSGARYSRELVDCGTSRVIKRDTNLIWVIRISRTERLRLDDVRR